MYVLTTLRVSASTCSSLSVVASSGPAMVAMGAPLLVGGESTRACPPIVVFARVNGHGGAHAVVSEAAELRACQFVLSHLRGLKPDANVHPRYRVLLDAEGRNKEGMDRVLRRQEHRHRLANRQVQLAAHQKVISRLAPAIRARITIGRAS